MKEGKQVFLLDDASINLLANCKNSISISGGLDGSVSIDSSALKLKGAKVAFDTPKLTLNAKGELESGIAKITLTMPEDTLGSLIKSQFNFPIAFREEIDFKLGRTGIRGDIFFKKPENGLKFDFDKKAIKVSCKPSVDGEVEGPLGPPVRATASLSATVTQTFQTARNSGKLSDLNLKLAINYGEIDFEGIGGKIEQIVVGELKPKLPSTFTLPLFDDAQLKNDPWIRRLSSPTASMSEKGGIVTIVVSATLNK